MVCLVPYFCVGAFWTVHQKDIHSMMKFLLNLVVKPASIKCKYIHKGTKDLMLAVLTPIV